LARIIWNRLISPKVDLANAKSRFMFFCQKGEIFACRWICDTDKSHLGRKAHLRPALHPTSIDPKIARAMINMSGIREGNLLDPFCGSGGILIEAALMGYKTHGYDIDPLQIGRANTNLRHYGIIDCNLGRRDSRTLDGHFDAIVTDLPYGRNSKAENLDELYLSFLKTAKSVTAVIVLCSPDSIDIDTIIKKSGWKNTYSYSYQVHKSLTRKICVLK
jgi:tRNA (guanine10-N2)-dimethyltransferase